MLGWYSIVKRDNYEIEQANKLLETELGFAQKELITYQEALVKHNDGASFNTEKSRISQQLSAKQALLTVVKSQSAVDAIDYYQVMKDLTEHHDHDMWLTNFHFNTQNAQFSGFALQSKAVTQWLTYLQATDSFKGREFKQLEIKAVNDDVVSFNTATQLGEVAGGAQ